MRCKEGVREVDTMTTATTLSTPNDDSPSASMPTRSAPSMLAGAAGMQVRIPHYQSGKGLKVAEQAAGIRYLTTQHLSRRMLAGAGSHWRSFQGAADELSREG
jgi:hypothetical protein